MDKRGITITVLAVVFVHVFLLVLVLLPGCSGTVPDGGQTGGFPKKAEPASAAKKSSPTPEVKAKKPERTGLPKAGRPAPLSAKNARSGPILDLKIWNSKQPKNYSRVCGILIDLNSRRILWQLNPEKAVPIASLSKIMALLVSYEALQSDDCLLSLDSEIEITPEARKVPPSGVGFRPEEKAFPLRKLMEAAPVKSANHAPLLIAQTFGNGDAEAFVKMMNDRALELGMTKTQFYNPHGLPGRLENKPDNVSSVRDLANLCEAYLTYPQLHKWSSTTAATFRTKNDLVSHNHLLIKGKFHTPGVSGIKTGYTINAGFCLAAVCDRKGRRLLAIVTGFNSAADRDRFTKNLLEWGFEQK